MLSKRIIPCLDVKDGRVVKGIHFVNLADAGDPVKLARQYELDGADELVILDISASVEGRKTMLEVVRNTAEEIFIPLTVGGGVSSVEDIRRLLLAGADKVSINSAAVGDPKLIEMGASRYGSQCIVVAIDASKAKGRHEAWNVLTHGGRCNTGKDVVEWAVTCAEMGAGEILLTSLNRDGTQNGYDIQLTNAVASAVSIPVIASGGAGTLNDFVAVLTAGKADAALAASLFHYGKIQIKDVKSYLRAHDVEVRS